MKPLGEEVIDQGLHLIVGFVVTILVHPLSIIQCVLCGLTLGLVREVTEDGKIWSGGSLRDLLFWTLGGFAAGMFWYA
jgi:hypothetical protein